MIPPSTCWLVLCIHEVIRRGAAMSPWALEWSRLDALLDQLRADGWAYSSLREPSHGSGDRRLVITVDDCRKGALEWLLAERRPTTTLFPIPAFMDDPDCVPSSERYSEFCSWSALRDALAAGHSIGSHGLTHRPLQLLSAPQMRRELQGSKELLSERLGVSVRELSLPYGRHDERVLRLASVVGYDLVMTTRPGLNEHTHWHTGLIDRILLRSDRDDLGLLAEVLG